MNSRSLGAMSLGLRIRGTKMARFVSKDTTPAPKPTITPSLYPRKVDTNGTPVPLPPNFPDPEAKKNTAKIRGTNAAIKGLVHSDKMG
jgi:hypothetical protein